MHACSALLFTLTVAIGQDLPSGPLVGDKLTEFKAHAFPSGKEIKLLEATKGKPTLMIFVQNFTRPGFQFLKPVDKYAAEHEKLATHIIWVAEKEKAEDYLKRAEKSLDLKAPISICLDGGKDGPPAYGLNDKVAITVLVAKDNKVIANFALSDPNANDSRKVIAAVAKMLGKDPPKGEK